MGILSRLKALDKRIMAKIAEQNQIDDEGATGLSSIFTGTVDGVFYHLGQPQDCSEEEWINEHLDNWEEYYG